MGVNWEDRKLVLARHLWETTALSAREIAVRVGGGATKGVIIGKARRDGWAPRRSGPRPATAELKCSETPKVARVKSRRTESAPLVVGVSSVDFMELQAYHCRWPLGGTGEHSRYCGARALPTGPYCAEHAGVAYNAPPPPRQTRPHYRSRYGR